MTYAIVFRHQARAEFDAAADWYERECPGLGAEFTHEIDQVLESITGNPNQFPKVLRDVRQAVVKRFPYCLYFHVRHPFAVILAVFHSARNPMLWRERN